MLFRSPFGLFLCLYAAHAAPADSAFRSGLSAYNSGDYVRAKSIWEPLAENEDAASQAGLGFMYHHGFGMAVDDKKAAYWSRKAAEHGQPEGQFMLGSLYFFGKGVPQSYPRAYAWCELAQDNGQAEAQMCRDAALQSITADEDMRTAFRMLGELRDRLGHVH